VTRRRLFAAPAAAAAATAAATAAETTATRPTAVTFSGDGIPHSPAEYARLLSQLAEAGACQPDSYSLGGVVEKLEARFAELLGKEQAVFLPTGTLANHLAVRLLASGARRRVLVQADSHLYADEGDCAQTLSNLNLVPMAAGRAAFTLDEVKKEVERGGSGRVAAPVGAISIESPVRRHFGEVMPIDSMRAVCRYARGEGIGLHLDGARLFLLPEFTGVTVRQYTELFDTVYVSLYKYFNASAGAILAGPKKLMDGLHHTRRMFGAGLPHAWPMAAVALHYAEGFGSQYARAVAHAGELFSGLAKEPGIRVLRPANSSHIIGVSLEQADPAKFRAELAKAKVSVAAYSADRGRFDLNVNETILRQPVEQLVFAFRQAIRSATATSI
jgi:threonine aldolase